MTTRYRHDGQMAIEDVEQPATGNATITRYGLGARGVDFMEQIAANGVVTKGFPIYDAHGNNVATLYRNGTGYAVQNLRRYSAWGNIRGGSPTGDPKGKYCANLGHRQDDESGLTYMRARYYEPDSARFISQDPAMDGANWFAYCGNEPISHSDSSGTRSEWFQIGKYWISFDTWYSESGTGKMLRDFNWGFEEGVVEGAIRYDGIIKHGAAPPEKLLSMLLKNKKFNSFIEKTAESHGGTGIGMTTLDAAFMADPIFVIGLFDDLGQGFHMFANLKDD